MQAIPIAGTFGADISGVRLGSLSDASFEDIYGAWLEYGVLRFRAQSLTKDDLQAFSQRFGPLEELPLGRLSAGQKAKIDNRYVTPISSIVVDGKPIGGLGDAEASVPELLSNGLWYLPLPRVRGDTDRGYCAVSGNRAGHATTANLLGGLPIGPTVGPA